MPIIFRKTQTGRIEDTKHVTVVNPMSAEVTKPDFTDAEIDAFDLVTRIKRQRELVEQAMANLADELAKLDELEPQADLFENGDDAGHVAWVYSDGRGGIHNSTDFMVKTWDGSGKLARWIANPDGTNRKLQWYAVNPK